MRSGYVHPEAAPSFGHAGILLLLSVLSVAILFASTPSIGAELTLQWDASEGAHGYVLHYGVQSNAYDTLIDVGPNVQHTVTGLDDGISYYFAVTAYNEHDESGFSSEISHATAVNQPPTANAGSDMSVEEMTTVTLNGSDSFDPDDGIKTLYWEQLSGPRVNLSDQESDICRFTAPSINSESETLVFQVVVQDYCDQVSSATCTVTVTSKADPPPPDDPGESETPVGAIAIQKAIYKTSKARLTLQARVEGGSADTVLTAWALNDGQEIKLGNLRYRTSKGYYGAFHNLDQAPDRIIIVSNTGGEASTTCTIR